MIYTKRDETRKVIGIKEGEVDHFQNEGHARGFRKSEINYDETKLRSDNYLRRNR